MFNRRVEYKPFHHRWAGANEVGLVRSEGERHQLPTTTTDKLQMALKILYNGAAAD